LVRDVACAALVALLDQGHHLADAAAYRLGCRVVRREREERRLVTADGAHQIRPAGSEAERDRRPRRS
jgi:hypothetical protein